LAWYLSFVGVFPVFTLRVYGSGAI